MAPPAEDLTRLEAFIAVGLRQLVGLAKLHYRTDGHAQPSRRSTADHAGEIAQLAMYLMLVSHGLEPKHRVIYVHRERLRILLNAVYQSAFDLLDWGRAADTGALKHGMRELEDFAVHQIPNSNAAGESLREFGVTSVKKSLAILTERLAMYFAHGMAADIDSFPIELVSASVIASSTSPAVAKLIGEGDVRDGLQRIAMNVALAATQGVVVEEHGPTPPAISEFLKNASCRVVEHTE
jgi:hypothetical protein